MSGFARQESLFHEALLRADGGERAKYLDEACGGDAELRREVEKLLAAHEGTQSFLNLENRKEEAGLREMPGIWIGRYELLKQIGEGGFGVVFMAQQLDPVKRKVALKVIKLGMDSRQVVARFEAERQALAIMDHPHIAKVLDGGTTETGRPYFVMEYVEGVSIVAYCDGRKLPTRERLRLFAEVCEAVQHAHQKGVIHRDIKPSNILVGEMDGKAVPKVIDFGIAKATEPLSDRTLVTEQRQMMGTPAYMSPEQASASADVDTRTDIYSLGVLLYELLTGATPFDGKELMSASHAEVQRIICEVEPPTPSSRVSTMGGAALLLAAEKRGVETRGLKRILLGELDWIVMKALEKDRGRRYESAGSLAADVGRYLRGEAVTARRTGAWYRVRKFARRRKGLVAAGVIVLAGIGVGVGGMVQGWLKSHENLLEVERQRDRAEAVQKLMTELIEDIDPNDAGAEADKITMLQVILRAVARLDSGEVKAPPDVEAVVRNSIGRVLYHLGDFTMAEHDIRKAIKLMEKMHPPDHDMQLEALTNLAHVLHGQDKDSEAELAYRQAIEFAKKAFPGNREKTRQGINILARFLADIEDDKAKELATQGLEMTREMFGPGSAEMIGPLNTLARVNYYIEDDLPKAEELQREAVRRVRQNDQPVNAVLGKMLYDLAKMLDYQKKYEEAVLVDEEAIRVLQASYPPGHKDILDARIDLMLVLEHAGDLQRAEDVGREALVQAIAARGKDDDVVRWAHLDVLQMLRRHRLTIETPPVEVKMPEYTKTWVEADRVTRQGNAPYMITGLAADRGGGDVFAWGEKQKVAVIRQMDGNSGAWKDISPKVAGSIEAMAARDGKVMVAMITSTEKDWTSVLLEKVGDEYKTADTVTGALQSVLLAKDGSVYTSISTSGSEFYGLVKKREPGGQWKTILDTREGGAYPAGETLGKIAEGIVGGQPALYVLGEGEWLFRKVGNGGWEQIQMNKGDESFVARDIAVDDRGRIFVAGVSSRSEEKQLATASGPLPVVIGRRVQWVVRRSEDGGKSWQTEDDYLPEGGIQSQTWKLEVGSDGRVFVGGGVQLPGKALNFPAVVRAKARDQWTTVEVPERGDLWRVDGMAVDTQGRAYIGGRSGSGDWVVRRSGP